MMADIEGLGLAPDRERYNIAQHRTIELRVGVTQPDVPRSPISTWFHCLTCDDVLDYLAERKLFECQCCGYTVSRTEAAELCLAHTKHVARFFDGLTPPPPKVKKKKRETI